MSYYILHSRCLKALLILFACSVSSYSLINADTIPIPGKVGFVLHDSFYVFENSNTKMCKFPIEGKGFYYGGFRWMNKANKLIGVEYFSDDKGAINRSNLVYFNLSGRVINTIYTSKHGEIADYPFLSRNDKRLLFTTELKGDIKLNHLNGLNGDKSIIIMDCQSGKLITQIERIGTSLNLELSESPWVYNEDQFVYSLSNQKQIKVDSIMYNSIKREEMGVYVYDINTGQRSLIVPGGRIAVCSPVDFRIGYIMDQSIWIKDLKNNSTQRIFDVGLNDRIINIHWTPDAQSIYIAYYKRDDFDKEVRMEKLINIKTKNETPFKKIGHGFRYYTWK